MSEEMAGEFSSIVSKLKSDPQVRVVVLTGAGEAFSGGGHLSMLEEKTRLSLEENERKMLDFYHAFLSIRELPVPVIAAINGHAVGAGCCLALACDVRIAAQEAKLGMNFVALGLHPGMAATYFLPRLVGPAVTAELLYAGNIITADEALRIGLVNRVSSGPEFQGEVEKLSAKIAANGPRSIRELRESLAMSPSRTLEECLKREAKAQAGNYIGEEFREGITAAREKRPAKFS
jgi:enoyl-CoA hydratase